MQIKRVRVWSAAKVCGVLGALVGVLGAGLAGLLSVISGQFYRGIGVEGSPSLGTRVGLVMAFPIAYAVLIWWLSTGCILYLDGLPKRTFPVSLAALSVLASAALGGLALTAHEATPRGAFVAFTCAIVVWAWMELSFLTGILTGPRRVGCLEHCGGAEHARHAIEAVLYHELAIVAGATAIVFTTWRAPNHVGLLTFVVLWVMRTSAKLNLFLGVRNLGEAFLPEHLAYLASFLRRRRMNALFPFSVTLGSIAVVAFAQRAAAPDAGAFEVAGCSLLASLLALAVLEHWFMVLPLPVAALWSGFKARGADKALIFPAPTIDRRVT